MGFSHDSWSLGRFPLKSGQMIIQMPLLPGQVKLSQVGLCSRSLTKRLPDSYHYLAVPFTWVPHKVYCQWDGDIDTDADADADLDSDAGRGQVVKVTWTGPAKSKSQWAKTMIISKMCKTFPATSAICTEKNADLSITTNTSKKVGKRMVYFGI